MHTKTNTHTHTQGPEWSVAAWKIIPRIKSDSLLWSMFIYNITSIYNMISNFSSKWESLVKGPKQLPIRCPSQVSKRRGTKRPKELFPLPEGPTITKNSPGATCPKNESFAWKGSDGRHRESSFWKFLVLDQI